MMSPEERIKNEDFLKNFTLAGFYKLKDDELEFEWLDNIRLLLQKQKIQGYVLLCVDGEIKFIGEAFSKRGICYTFNSLKTGGTPGKRGTTTWQRINKNIKRYEKRGRIVQGYFIESIKNNDYKNKYDMEFNRLPGWCKQKSNGRNNESVFEITELDRNVVLEDEKYNRIKEVDRALQPIRNYPEKVRALENSGDRCALCEYMKANYGSECINFERRNSILGNLNRNYLEVHHLIPLSLMKIKEKFGLEDFEREDVDVAENMVCLCSNCHNKIHYGLWEEVKPMLEYLYKQKETDLENIGLDIGIPNLLEFYGILCDDKL